MKIYNRIHLLFNNIETYFYEINLTYVWFYGEKNWILVNLFYKIDSN